MAVRFGSRLISRAIKTENPLPRSLFAPKPNGNACLAGYGTLSPRIRDITWLLTLIIFEYDMTSVFSGNLL